MSFDAGEIIATLKLEREKFNLELDAALADAEAKTKDGIDVKVKPELDTVAVEEVLAEEEPLRKDIKAEVKPTYAKSEAESVGRALATDIVSGAESGGGGSGGKGGAYSSIIGRMIAAGTSPADIKAAMAALKVPWGEVESSLSADAAAYFATEASSGGSGGGAGKTIARDIAQSIFGPAGTFDKTLQTAVLGATKGDTQASLIGPIVRAMMGNGFSTTDIQTGLRSAGFSATNISAAITNEMRGGITDLERNGGGVAIKNDLQAMFGKILGASGTGGGKGSGIIGIFDNLWGGTGAMKLVFNPIGAAAGTAFLGAFGNVLGGMAAGTAIGGAGVFAALIPGYVDVMKGIAASTAIGSGASTKGMSKSQIALGQQIQKLIGAGSKGLGAAEITIMPDITKFAKALGGLIPEIKKFSKPAINAMAGFFDSIDKGMKSKNFTSFVNDMAKLVGPTMKDFGSTILNLGGAFGGFLKLFGPVGKDQVGPWFVKTTKEFDKFMNHIKIGPGFEKGSKTVFGAIGAWIKIIDKGMKGVGSALAPIGLAFFQISGFIATVLNKVPLAAPLMVTLGTALVTLSIGLKAIALAQALFGPAVALFDPEFFAFAAAAAALYVALKDLLSVPKDFSGSMKQIGQWSNDLGLGGVTQNFSGSVKQIVQWGKDLGISSGNSSPTKKKPTHHVTINVDASGHKNPVQVGHAVHSAISATLPSLQAALARGAT